MIKKPACAGSAPQCLFAPRELEQAYRPIPHGVAGYTYDLILHKLGKSRKVLLPGGCRSAGRLLYTSFDLIADSPQPVFAHR